MDREDCAKLNEGWETLRTNLHEIAETYELNEQETNLFLALSHAQIAVIQYYIEKAYAAVQYAQARTGTLS